MKRFLLIAALCSLILPLRSQWLWDYGVAVGVSNYLGDIGGKDKTRRDFVADMKLAKTRWNVGGFVRYKWLPRISYRLAFDYLRVEGDDKLSTNPGRFYRNFNFRNDVFDLGATAHFFFYENNDLGNNYRYKNGFRAYIFGGIGAFYNNPKTNYNGQWVKLRPLQTEGYAYKSIVMNLPSGFGFYFTFDKKHRLGYEFNWRKTFTDYMDDISGNYPDAPPADGLVRDVVLRTPELGQSGLDANPGAYLSHTWGSKRGDKSNKDAYITMNLTYSYVIRGKSSFYRTRYNGFFGGKKRKVRKIRAKF
jgi:hypothetical protein